MTMNNPVDFPIDCQDLNQEGGKPWSHHDEETIRLLVARMNRIESQIRGIRGMIKRQTYYDDVQNQITSAQSALDGVSRCFWKST